MHLVCKWLSEWIIGEVYKLDVLECISLIFLLKLYFDIIGNVHIIYDSIHFQIQGGDIEKVTENRLIIEGKKEALEIGNVERDHDWRAEVDPPSLKEP